MEKRLIILLALATLLIFPIPTFLVMYFAYGIGPIDVLQLHNLKFFEIILGIEYGIIYAQISILILRLPIFERVPLQIEKVVKGMNFTYLEGIFISFCAGFGEEILFRSGMQYFLGIWLTSFIFVAIHGYFSIRNPLNSLYGLIVLPFIVGISYGFEYYGLWFAIAAHFAYDAVLFTNIRQDNSSSVE